MSPTRLGERGKGGPLEDQPSLSLLFLFLLFLLPHLSVFFFWAFTTTGPHKDFRWEVTVASFRFSFIITRLLHSHSCIYIYPVAHHPPLPFFFFGLLKGSYLEIENLAGRRRKFVRTEHHIRIIYINPLLIYNLLHYGSSFNIGHAGLPMSVFRDGSGELG